MSVVIFVLGRSVNSPHLRPSGFSTSPSTNRRQALVGISGWTPRSSTGQVSTSRCPGGRRCEWAAVFPVSRRPSSAHFFLVSISLLFSLPNRVTSSSAMMPFSDTPSRLLPIWGAQLPFEDLTGVLAWQGSAEFHHPRHLVARQVLAEIGPHRRPLQGRPRQRLDMGADLLAEFVVGNAEHRAVAHARHLDQHALD